MRLKDITPVPAFPRSIGTLPETTKPHPLAQRHLREGRKRFNEDLWPEAIAELEKALEFDPRLTEAHLLLARAALQYGDDSKAESQLREVLKYHARNVSAHRLLGEIAWRNKKTTDAITELRLALLADTDQPGSPEAILARWTLASALREAGYFLAAAHQLDVYLAAVDSPSQSMKDHPELRESMERNRSTAIVMLAELRTELGDHAAAAAAYSNATTRFPDDASLRRKLAFALARAGQGEAALEAARRWSLDLPQPIDGLETLKEICELLGRPRQYENELIRLAESTHDARMVMDLGMTLLDRGQPTEARTLLQRATNRGALDARGRYLLARLIAQSGEAAEAYRLIIATLQENPTSEGQVMRLLEGSDFEIDSSIFLKPAEKMAVATPDNAFARFGLGFLLMHHHEDDRAAEELDAAIDLDNSFGAPHAAKARLSIRQKRWAIAIAIAEDAIAHGIKSARLQLCKGLAHDALDEYAEAESAFLESFSLDRSSPLPLFRLAQSFDRRGEAQRCEELYRRILDDVDPRFMPAREQLVLWYLNRGLYVKCREYFSDFERLDQRGPIVNRCRALLELTTTKADTAKARLEEYTRALRAILKEYPDDAPTWLELARSYSTVNDFDRALEHVESSLRIDPDYLQARELKAVVLAKKLEFDLARKTVEGLLVDRPRDAAYLRKLLDIARNCADFQAEIDLLKRLIERDDLNKRRNAYTSQLIDVLLRSDQLDEAIASSKKWLDESPKDRVRRRIHLSTLTRAGRHDEAVELAEQYLKESPDERSEQIQLLIQLQGAKRYTEAQQRVLAWLSDSGNDIELNIALVRLCWNSKQWDDAIDIARTGAELPEYRLQYEGLLGMSYLSDRAPFVRTLLEKERDP
ncbi:MAG: tetratricopeptide repeat protein, partial [Phycisphaerae bacterium]